MVNMRYVGIADPCAAFAELAEARRKLADMRLKYRPYSEEWKLLDRAEDALREAADKITGREDFFRVVRGDGAGVLRGFRG
jgi:hypothetical protein